MAIEGFSRREKGKQAGLVWMNFTNLQVKDLPGTPGYDEGMRVKAKAVMRLITTELSLGTKHYNKGGHPLKTLKDIIASYSFEGGFYVEWPEDRRWKFDGLAEKYGIDTKGHDTQNPDLGDQGQSA